MDCNFDSSFSMCRRVVFFYSPRCSIIFHFSLSFCWRWFWLWLNEKVSHFLSVLVLEISDCSHNKTMLTFTTTKCHSRKRKDFMCFVGHYTFSLPFQKALKEWRNSSHKSKLAKWHTRAASDKIIISTEWNHQTMLFDSSKLPSVSYTHTRFGFINIVHSWKMRCETIISDLTISFIGSNFFWWLSLMTRERNCWNSVHRWSIMLGSWVVTATLLLVPKME